MGSVPRLRAQSEGDADVRPERESGGRGLGGGRPPCQRRVFTLTMAIQTCARRGMKSEHRGCPLKVLVTNDTNLRSWAKT